MNSAGNSPANSLPVIQEVDSQVASNRQKSIQRLAVHWSRVALLLSIVLLIRWAHRGVDLAESDLSSSDAALQFATKAFPTANSIEHSGSIIAGNRIITAEGECVGYLLQTSPQSDHLIGYSGPTNCLIAMDKDHKIIAVKLLSSGDTVDHFEILREDQQFLGAFKGVDFKSENEWKQIDAVSGATLTSHAVIASIANRIGEKAPSLKFSASPQIENVRALFSIHDGQELSLRPSDIETIWNVIAGENKSIGHVLITTPNADDLSGYQGPTATLVGFDIEKRCVGVVVDQTYDNQPYANYLNDDAFFQSLYRGKTIDEIAELTPAAAEIDGVSGATMTSVCVAEGLAVAASVEVKRKQQTTEFASGKMKLRGWPSYLIDVSTILLTLIGIAFSFTSLTKMKWLRFGYQILVIAVLGFVSGQMLSQASIAGWSTHAIPWKVAPGLVFLSFAAFLVPITSRHQPYCQHICPFGAIQQISRNRLGWRLTIPSTINQWRSVIPLILLIVTVWVAMTGTQFNLASIEPFDGFSFRVAGWATISILVLGLLLSLVSPMVYCRFGCPTGAMLNFVRFRSDSHRIGIRDVAAIALLLIAVALLLK